MSGLSFVQFGGCCFENEFLSGDVIDECIHFSVLLKHKFDKTKFDEHDEYEVVPLMTFLESHPG